MEPLAPHHVGAVQRAEVGTGNDAQHELITSGAVNREVEALKTELGVQTQHHRQAGRQCGDRFLIQVDCRCRSGDECANLSNANGRKARKPLDRTVGVDEALATLALDVEILAQAFRLKFREQALRRCRSRMRRTL
jgi:hypothetical protein